MKLWNSKGKLLNSFTLDQKIYCIIESNDNNIISGMENGIIKIWE